MSLNCGDDKRQITQVNMLINILIFRIIIFIIYDASFIHENSKQKKPVSIVSTE